MTRGFLEAGMLYQPVSIGGRVTVLAMGSFAMVLIAFFTAGLTESLILASKFGKQPIRTMADVEMANIYVCAPRVREQSRTLCCLSLSASHVCPSLCVV
jgi:hypothetical protein